VRPCAVVLYVDGIGLPDLTGDDDEDEIVITGITASESGQGRGGGEWGGGAAGGQACGADDNCSGGRALLLRPRRDKISARKSVLKPAPPREVAAARGGLQRGKKRVQEGDECGAARARARLEESGAARAADTGHESGGSAPAAPALQAEAQAPVGLAGGAAPSAESRERGDASAVEWSDELVPAGMRVLWGPAPPVSGRLRKRWIMHKWMSPRGWFPGQVAVSILLLYLACFYSVAYKSGSSVGILTAVAGLVRGEWSPQPRVTRSNSVRIPINNLYRGCCLRDTNSKMTAQSLNPRPSTPTPTPNPPP
jgi:hypothetical protein